MEEKIILAGGCFWCTEAVFSQIDGINKITPGYIGGVTQNPTYKEVCKGDTNHAEAIEVLYDSKIISLADILHIFFATHDPTTLNRQGGDIGTQYRSAIFYEDEKQHKLAEDYIKTLTDNEVYEQPIVTTLEPATTFYPAEAEHMEYYKNNPNQPFCSMVIAPKLAKVHQLFAEKLKRK